MLRVCVDRVWTRRSMSKRFWYSAGPRRKRFRCSMGPCVVCEIVSNNADPYTGSMGIHGSALVESGPGIHEIENKKLRRGIPLQPQWITPSNEKPHLTVDYNKHQRTSFFNRET